MVLNYNDTQNKDIVNHVQDTLILNPITDAIPKSVIPSIQPVFEVYAQNLNIVRSGTATGTIYTTPSDVDFYLTNIFMSIADTSPVGTSLSLILSYTTEEGTAISERLWIGGDDGLTSAGSPHHSRDCTFPLAGIKLKRNTTIAITTSLTEAYARIVGYTKQGGNNRSV